jgi:hypothetical protein
VYSIQYILFSREIALPLSLTDVSRPFETVWPCWEKLGRTIEAKPGIHYTNALCRVSWGLNWLVTSTTLDAVHGQDTSVRDATSKGRDVQGTRRPRDASSKRRNIRDFLFWDISVWDTVSRHQHTPLSLFEELERNR